MCKQNTKASEVKASQGDTISLAGSRGDPCLQFLGWHCVASGCWTSHLFWIICKAPHFPPPDEPTCGLLFSDLTYAPDAKLMMCLVLWGTRGGRVPFAKSWGSDAHSCWRQVLLLSFGLGNASHGFSTWRTLVLWALERRYKINK